MTRQDHLGLFEANRSFLLNLAYRILGSRVDAEDAVQDSYIKFRSTDLGTIANPAAWLTTACTRHCIDLLRASHRTRVSYVGTWLPEPLHTPTDDDLDAKMDLSKSLSTAFILMLERLTPRERAAYLLHDIFEQSYAEVAAVLGLEEAACRKLVSRAKGSIDQDRVRYETPIERQNELLAAFQAAVTGGNTDVLSAMLASDVALRADGGGKVTTVSATLTGKAEVMPFIAEKLSQYWADYSWQFTELNGGRAVVLSSGTVAVAAITFAFDADGRATDIFIMRNPDKLASLGGAALH